MSIKATQFNHLYLHNNSRYYYRRVYPVDVQYKVKKLDFCVSLKTTELSTALLRKRNLDAEYLRQVQKMRLLPASDDVVEQAKYIKSVKHQNTAYYEEATDALANQIIHSIALKIGSRNLINAMPNLALTDINPKAVQKEREAIAILKDEPLLSKVIKEYLVPYQDKETGASSKNIYEKEKLLDRVLAFFGDIPVNSMTEEQAVAFSKQEYFRKQSNGNSYAESTLRDRIGLFKKFTKYLKIENYHTLNIARDCETSYLLKTKKTRINNQQLIRVSWTDEELLTIAKGLKKRAGTIVNNKQQAFNKTTAKLITFWYIGFYTGLRISEISKLERAHIDLDNNYIDNTKGKSKAAKRNVPIHNRLIPFITALLEINDGSPYLIPHLTFDKYEETRAGNVSPEFSNFKTQLGFSREKVFHNFRRWLITKLKHNEVSVDIVKDIVGHENGKRDLTFDIYGELHKVKTLSSYINKVVWTCEDKDLVDGLISFALKHI